MDGRPQGANMKKKYVVWCLLALVGAASSWPGAANGPGESLLPFTEGELRAIMAHGPWPAPWVRDPSNRVSGNEEAIAFGERLFFETRLSGHLQHPHRIVICSVPKIVVEMAEKPARGRLPRPPEIESDLSQWFERRRQGRDYIINLEGRHELRRNGKVAKKSSVGKFLRSLDA